MKQPSTTFDFVLEWMKKAEATCRKQGRNDSAQLWKDAMEHLIYLHEENNRLNILVGDKK